MIRDKVETVLNQMKRGACNQTSVTITALGQQLVPFVDDRVSLIFCADAVSDLVVSRQPDSASGVGITIPHDALPLVLSLATHGAIVKGPFFVSGGTVPLTYTYLESINHAP